VPGGRGQARRGHQSQDVRGRQEEKGQGNIVGHAAVRSYIRDIFPSSQGQW